jgi:hypothetical protein
MPQENPPLLDKTMNTTETNPRNLADVLASGLANIANNVKPDGSDISISVPGMSATNVDDGFSELKGTLDGLQTIDTIYTNTTFHNDIGGEITLSKNYDKYKFLLFNIGVTSFDSWNITEFTMGVAFRSSFTGFFVFGLGNNLYTIRLSTNQSNRNKVAIISSSASSLSIRYVYGIL